MGKNRNKNTQTPPAAQTSEYPKVVDGVRYFKDGDVIFAVDDATFENIQESVSGYGHTDDEALAMLRDPENIKAQEDKIAANADSAEAEAARKASEELAAQEKADADEKARLKKAEAEAAAAPVDSKVFWVEGYGNVRAKSQAAAEKKAKKIIADRRR